MLNLKQIAKNGLFTENPVLIQVIGLCPTLATTTSAKNGLGMGLVTALVLMMSNLTISAIRSFVPGKVRLPTYISVIAGFVTVLELTIKAYMPVLDTSLGLYIPLIVANCIPLARAEMFAAKHNVVESATDGLFMGLGFSLALTTIGSIREFLGTGMWFGFHVLPEAFPKTLAMIFAPGAFFTIAFIMATINYRKEKSKKEA